MGTRTDACKGSDGFGVRGIIGGDFLGAFVGDFGEGEDGIFWFWRTNYTLRISKNCTLRISK